MRAFPYLLFFEGVAPAASLVEGATRAPLIAKNLVSADALIRSRRPVETVSEESTKPEKIKAPAKEIA